MAKNGINMNKTPCKKCLCVPICRHKPYIQLIAECCLLKEYLYVETNKDNRSFLERVGFMDFILGTNHVYETHRYIYEKGSKVFSNGKKWY